MQTTKVNTISNSQTVKIPKGYELNGSEIFVHKYGHALLLIPCEKSWEVFLEGLDGFSDDFMKEGRNQGINQDRECLDVHSGY